MSKKHYLVPDYILKFKCSMCGKCCRTDWKIQIDKITMDCYKNMAQEDKLFALEVENNIKKNKNGTAEIKFNNIQEKLSVTERINLILDKTENEMNDTGEKGNNACSFLTNDCLCSIQKRYSADLLTDICKTYPRHVVLTERGFEMSLYYSCPVAAQLLKEKNAIEFYQDPEGFDFVDLHEHYDRIRIDKDKKNTNKEQYYELEEILIDIMQTREMNIATRLLLAGTVVDKVKNNEFGTIELNLENCIDEIFHKIKNIKSAHTSMLMLIKEAVDMRITLEPLVESDMQKLFYLAYIKLRLLDDTVISEYKVKKFINGYNRYYKPFEQDVSHIYENYFVNYIFSKKFYTYAYSDAYFLMILCYELIRFFTVCRCMGEEKNVSQHMIVESIKAIEHSIAHNSHYYCGILDLAKEKNYINILFACSIINI